MPTSIPAFHASDLTQVDGSGDVFIASRKDAVSAGVFTVRVSAHFDPAVDDYPIGTLQIRTDLSDSVDATYSATSIELMNSFGKHNPTAFLTGRCTANSPAVAAQHRGLRYWLMVANNQAATVAPGTPDVVGFVIHDRDGNRVAYGTGPLKSGDFNVKAK